MNVGGHCHAWAAVHPGRFPVVTEVSWFGPRVGLEGFYRTENSFSPPEIETRTIQTVVSHYTDYTTPCPQNKDY